MFGHRLTPTQPITPPLKREQWQLSWLSDHPLPVYLWSIDIPGSLSLGTSVRVKATDISIIIFNIRVKPHRRGSTSAYNSDWICPSFWINFIWATLISCHFLIVSNKIQVSKSPPISYMRLNHRCVFIIVWNSIKQKRSTAWVCAAAYRTLWSQHK